MEQQKSYIDYKFLGIRSFVATLEETETDYRIFEADDFSSLYRENPDILKEGEDTITSGIIIKGEQGLYFTEFGLKITKSYRSNVVFIFNRHPRIEDLQSVVQELPELAEQNVENIDIAEVAQSIQEMKKKKEKDLQWKEV